MFIKLKKHQNFHMLWIVTQTWPWIENTVNYTEKVFVFSFSPALLVFHNMLMTGMEKYCQSVQFDC